METVAELITKLENFPPETPVRIDDGWGNYTLSRISSTGSGNRWVSYSSGQITA